MGTGPIQYNITYSTYYSLCQVEWSSPGTKYRLGANRLGFGQIPGASVSGYVLDTVEVII